jgi:polyribonucleotide nucleotidyltransferase
MKQTVTIPIAGRDLILETGELAAQAESAILARYGDTVVLATVAVSKSDSTLSYFPLTVEYSEKLYAGGRIKGSRWVKREGRPSDDVILKARLIDRSIRPLFPKEFKRDVQIVVTVLSIDQENDPDIVGLLAVSAALSISSLPWNGPIAAVRVGTADGEFIVNPTTPQTNFSDLDLVVSANNEKILMIEAGARQIPEEQMLEGIEYAHENIKSILSGLSDFIKKAGKQKIKLLVKSDSDQEFKLTKEEEQKAIVLQEKLAVHANGAHEAFSEFFSGLVEKYKELFSHDKIYQAVDKAFYHHMRKIILDKGKRIDGRSLTELRPLSAKVSILPRTHGSAIFARGETQALTIVTLAPPSLEQWLESPIGEETKRYMHHYNMPPFSVGETGRMGWPSRREIGHGALAERALEPVIPSAKDFPYTIRVVSEILSSNGSTSMASVCGSTLSLMDAGVPILEPVAGISIGLVTNGNHMELLTDILGVEDFNGDMDFKVAGTKNGITAIQLDIKIDGLTPSIIKETFKRAKEARLKILEVMLAELPATRAMLSKFAPKVKSIVIPQDKIGELIGPGGRNIRGIIADTGCDVNVEDDGSVTISGQDEEKVTEAYARVESIIKEVKVGDEFTGKVTRILPFGAFVEFLPGKEGLVHLSRMSTQYIRHPEEVVKIGQEVKVNVFEVDAQGRINLSMLFGKDLEAKQQHGSRDRKFGYDNRKRDRFSKTRYHHHHLEENS